MQLRITFSSSLSVGLSSVILLGCGTTYHAYLDESETGYVDERGRDLYHLLGFCADRAIQRRKAE